MIEFKSHCTKVLSEIRKNSTFLAVHHYVNNFGEVSDFSICFHVSYLNAVERARQLLEEYEPTAVDCVGKPYSTDHLRIARLELIESYQMTLAGDNPLATSADSYELVMDKEKEPIPGIKLHRDQDIIHLWGFGLHKSILMPGNYPKDNRYLKTIAKDDLRVMSPLGKFVQFKLTPGKFHKIVVEGMTIKEIDTIRDSHRRLVKHAFSR